MVKNGNFTLPLLKLIEADQLADLLVDLHLLLLTSSGQEWQFHIAPAKAHIGRSTSRSVVDLAPWADI